MALRIEKAFGVKMDTLMRVQSSYDIARTRQRAGKIAFAATSQPRRAHETCRVPAVAPADARLDLNAR